MNEGKSFNIHDSTVLVATEAFKEDWGLYNALRRLLKDAGFSCHQDPYVKKHWRTLARTHHAGARRDVHFASEICPTGMKVMFHEDVIRDNKNGARYHFDKMLKMPYLRRLAVRLMHRKIARCLEEFGFKDKSYVAPENALDYIHARRGEIEAFHGTAFYRRPVELYNSKDAEGGTLADGELRYFRSRSGHLRRGPVYHNLNGMWWVAVSPFEARNVASSEFFSYDAARHGKKDVPDRVPKMKVALKRAVLAEDFERACGIRDAIRRVEKTVEAPVTA